MWVCRNVIGTTHEIDGWNPTHQNGDEGGMVQMALLYQHYTNQSSRVVGTCMYMSHSSICFDFRYGTTSGMAPLTQLFHSYTETHLSPGWRRGHWPSGKRSHTFTVLAIEHDPVEIVDFHITNMVDLFPKFFVKWPEGIHLQISLGTELESWQIPGKSW